jgi:hypothetical protein
MAKFLDYSYVMIIILLMEMDAIQIVKLSLDIVAHKQQLALVYAI